MTEFMLHIRKPDYSLRIHMEHGVNLLEFERFMGGDEHGCFNVDLITLS